MAERIKGEKYEAGLSTTQIAAKARAEIKAAIRAGTLPAGSYSVRKDHHKSIVVRIEGLGIQLHNPEWLRQKALRPYEMTSNLDFPRYTPRAKAVLAYVNALLEAYNYDGSDIQSDYFDVNFYLDVSFGDDGGEYEDGVAYYQAVGEAQEQMSADLHRAAQAEVNAAPQVRPALRLVR